MYTTAHAVTTILTTVNLGTLHLRRGKSEISPESLRRANPALLLSVQLVKGLNLSTFTFEDLLAWSGRLALLAA